MSIRSLSPFTSTLTLRICSGRTTNFDKRQLSDQSLLAVTPLPENSTSKSDVRDTGDNLAPQNVTLSVIACYTPSTAATVVSTGTPAGTPTATTVSTGTGTGAQTTLVITTTTGGVVTGMSSTRCALTQSGFHHR